MLLCGGGASKDHRRSLVCLQLTNAEELRRPKTDICRLSLSTKKLNTNVSVFWLIVLVITLQLYIHSDKPSKLICSPHLSHNLSYIICILSQRNMFLTMLVDLVVFRLYITLICSFLHYITLNTTLRVTSALQHSATWQFHESDWQDTEEVSLCLDRCCGTHYH